MVDDKLFTRQDILNDLDGAGIDSPYKFFIDLEHGYLFTAGSRISLFADNNRWAIVFEKNGYNNRSFEGLIELNYFGNCLINLTKGGLDDKYICNTSHVTIITDENFHSVQRKTGGKDGIDEDFEVISPEAKFIKVRETLVPIEHDITKYKQKSILGKYHEKVDNEIDFVALIRYLDETDPNLLRANEEELRNCIPHDLPLLMQIDKWHHERLDFYLGSDAEIKPSTYETYQLIADVLVNSDPEKWKPTLEPNNDWRNYPDAGNL
jgi:hypothetical protein